MLKTRRNQLVVLFLVLISIGTSLYGCGTQPTNTQPANRRPSVTVQSTVAPTLAPESTATFPVCNEKVTNTPCVEFASIQDAAAGESEVGANVHTSISKEDIVSVLDDITGLTDMVGSPVNTLDAIQFQCFNIQQGLWYGLESTINTDASKTIRKSAFSEVDVSFIDNHKSPALFAYCNLTSMNADKIDKAGMWDDGDFTGAWALYNSTSFT
jgi:hypothetical protein